MVQGGPPAFLRLSDGVVLGSPTAAEAAAPVDGGPVVAGSDAPAAPTAKTAPTAPTPADSNADPEAGQ